MHFSFFNSPAKQFCAWICVLHAVFRKSASFLLFIPIPLKQIVEKPPAKYSRKLCMGKDFYSSAKNSRKIEFYSRILENWWDGERENAIG